MNATANVAITPSVLITPASFNRFKGEELIEVRAHGAAFNHKAPCAVKHAGFVDGERDGAFNARQSSAILARSCEAGTRFVAIGNQTATADCSPSIAPDFESSASANSATPATRSLKLRNQEPSSSASEP